jgi:hypothetical protein
MELKIIPDTAVKAKGTELYLSSTMRIIVIGSMIAVYDTCIYHVNKGDKKTKTRLGINVKDVLGTYH